MDERSNAKRRDQGEVMVATVPQEIPLRDEMTDEILTEVSVMTDESHETEDSVMTFVEMTPAGEGVGVEETLDETIGISEDEVVVTATGGKLGKYQRFPNQGHVGPALATSGLPAIKEFHFIQNKSFLHHYPSLPFTHAVQISLATVLFLDAVTL